MQGTEVSLSNLQVGDILYWGAKGSAYHVGRLRRERPVPRRGEPARASSSGPGYAGDGRGARPLSAVGPGDAVGRCACSGESAAAHGPVARALCRAERPPRLPPEEAAMRASVPGCPRPTRPRPHGAPCSGRLGLHGRGRPSRPNRVLSRQVPAAYGPGRLGLGASFEGGFRRCRAWRSPRGAGRNAGRRSRRGTRRRTRRSRRPATLPAVSDRQRHDRRQPEAARRYGTAERAARRLSTSRDAGPRDRSAAGTRPLRPSGPPWSGR